MDFKSFQRVSLLDYPGKIAAICFTGGCNMRCGYCYNRDLVLCPGLLPSTAEEEILNYLQTNGEWLDGIVVTGGEPTVQSDLPQFLEKVKALGYSVKLDTNGSNPEMLAALMQKGLIDYVALDVKAPLIEEKYREVVGNHSNGIVNSVKTSVEILKSGNVEYEVRTTVIPNLSREDLILIADQMRGAKRYYLQQFISDCSHIDERYSSMRPYPLEFLLRIRSEIMGYFGTCKIRGGRRR